MLGANLAVYTPIQSERKGLFKRQCLSECLSSAREMDKFPNWVILSWVKCPKPFKTGLFICLHDEGMRTRLFSRKILVTLRYLT